MIGKKDRIVLLFCFFLLLGCLVTYSPHISLVQAGPIFKWANRFASDIDYGNGTHTLTANTGPCAFWDNVSGSWQGLIFENHTDALNPYYLVRNAHVTAKIGYSSQIDQFGVLYYDPDFTEKRAAEFWNVQAYASGNWVTLDKYYYNNTVAQDGQCVNVTLLFRCVLNAVQVGWLQIKYVLGSAMSLKHEVIYKSTASQSIEYRAVMTLMGIAGEKVIHALGESTVTLNETQIESYWLRFLNASNPMSQFLEVKLDGLGHYLENGTWVNDYLKAIRLKLADYEGVQLVRCDVVIGNYTLAQSQILQIDPAISTFHVDVSLPYLYSQPHSPLGTTYCSSENLVTGTSVSGDHSTTHALDGVYRQIDEADTAGAHPEQIVYGVNNQNPGTWTNPTYAYNNNTANGATKAWTTAGACGYLVVNMSGTTIGTKIQYWVQRSNTAITTMEIGVANQTGSWSMVFNSSSVTWGAWANATITQSTYTALRIQFYKTGTASRTATIFEVQGINASIPYNYGLEVQYDFENVGNRTMYNMVTYDVYGYFTEGAGLMVIEIYNWDSTTWTTFSGKVPSSAGWVSNVIISSLPNPYISLTGTVRIRLKDSTADTTKHRLYIDQQYDDATYSQDPGASGNDGQVYGRSNVNYATAHGTAYGATASGIDLLLGQYFSAGLYWYVYRNFLKYDTSSISAGATISSAKLCLNGEADNTDTDFVIRLQKWTADTPITTADYNSFDGTNYDDGLFSTSAWSITGYNNITISTTSLITKAGNTLICVRSSRDVGSNAPTGYEYLSYYSYDQGAGYRPLLQVTYTTGESVPPTYTTIGSNETKAGYPIICYVLWADETALSGFIFGTNNTGTFTNQTWTATVSGWGNYSFTLNTTVGVAVQWEEWCNDTSNNWNNTGLQTITTIFYASLTIVTASHSWTVNPGDNNATINESWINITVTANANFNVQVKGSGALTYGSETIALSNVLVHATAITNAIAMTTGYQNVPGLTNQASGSSLAVAFKLWLSAPLGIRAGTYQYTLSVQIVQS